MKVAFLLLVLGISIVIAENVVPNEPVKDVADQTQQKEGSKEIEEGGKENGKGGRRKMGRGGLFQHLMRLKNKGTDEQKQKVEALMKEAKAAKGDKTKMAEVHNKIKAMMTKTRKEADKNGKGNNNKKGKGGGRKKNSGGLFKHLMRLKNKATDEQKEEIKALMKEAKAAKGDETKMAEVHNKIKAMVKAIMTKAREEADKDGKKDLEGGSR